MAKGQLWRKRRVFKELKVTHMYPGPMSCCQVVYQKAPGELPGLLPDGKASIVATSLRKYEKNNNNYRKNNPQTLPLPCHNNCISYFHLPTKPVLTTEK